MPSQTDFANPETGASERKTFFTQAQETASSALSSTTSAARDHPVAAAAVVAGAAAAVAGAAYGASKLMSNGSGKNASRKK
ncbi:hypothetical protein [Sphingomonas sp. DT-204]|uniref:hypothetical protein n=1 Tax=Sphingomonas sp. DT-204 TaxID=3396166 RepID=UPI003F1E02ED